MMEELAARVECDPDLADVTVATLAFPHQLLGASKGKYTKQTASLLYRYECEVKEGKKKKIIFPVNVGNSHWVAGVVDFTKKNQSRRFSARFFRAAQNIHQGCEKVASAPIRRSFPFRVRHTRAWRPERWIQLWDRYVQYLRASLVPRHTPLDSAQRSSRTDTTFYFRYCIAHFLPDRRHPSQNIHRRPSESTQWSEQQIVRQCRVLRQ
ncbi:hypothetical protein B0H10DRAFT_2083840 [Mycena sp. CBHHK59/15]|nr:hypothetical protein B0H10DRAFT_2083840 [Mycena sp. CBHHK59/15]